VFLNRTAKKIFKYTALGFPVMIGVVIAAFFWYRQASQPGIDGHIRVPGLKAAVEIVRDGEGVPHIFASSAADAYFALGFVHAQDRLWQLEINRRIAAGRLAEILGPDALNTDRFLRTLGVRRNAEAILAGLNQETRQALDAYAQGINSYLATHSGPLPPEFLLTGAPKPSPWHPADSIAWQTMMAWDLGANWTQELLRMRLSQRLTLEQINQFLPPYPGDLVLPTRDYTQLYRSLAGVTEQLAAIASIAPPSGIEGAGSNNWVLSGERTTSGKPLLANDPHLALAAPSLWYFAHLSAPDLNVIGATLPGIPCIVLGRTDRIAWGFTNTAPDVQDLYIERVNPENSLQYQTPQGWREFERRTEKIKVKGGPDVQLEIRGTRHGPVLTGALPITAKAPLEADQYVISFAWTALRQDDRTVQAGIGFNRARNWNEFREAAKDFGAPQQNIVYADVDGNIGFVAPGLVPMRHPENDLKGLAPAPGWDSRYDWIGFIPFDELPKAFNPPSQRIVTANEKIVDHAYPHFLTSEWSLPYRAQRIHALLDAPPKHDLKGFTAMQQDALSLAAQELLPIVRAVKPASNRDRRALEMLRAWNGAMAVESSQALIFNAWMRESSRRIFMDELGDDLMADYWEQRNAHQPMVQVLKNTSGQSAWCKDVRANPGPDAEACMRLLSDSLHVALSDLEQRFGKDMTKWQWGQAHIARAEHRPFGNVASLAGIFDIRVPSPGDTYTVNVGRYSLRNETEPFSNRHAAGLRAVYDLADLENSVFIHSTGQSGNVLSPLYQNYTERWANGHYIPMQVDRAAIEKDKMGSLRLEP
jgi:penicillin amidase